MLRGVIPIGVAGSRFSASHLFGPPGHAERNLQFVFEEGSSQLLYQLSWQTLPGTKGLSCSGFRAVVTSSPDSKRGVAFECSSEAECAALLLRLEAHFGAQRFSNNASAFETVKAYVVDWRGAKK